MRALAALLLCAGCTALQPGDVPAPGDDGGDGVDAGRFDAGPPVADAGPLDATLPRRDAGPFDAGVPRRDAAPFDAGSFDGGLDGGLDGGPPRACGLTTTTPPISVHAGGNTSCVRRDDGVFCWGDNRERQIDPDSTEAALPPTLVVAGEVTDVCVGPTFICVLLGNQVICAGSGPAAAPFSDGPVSLTIGQTEEIVCGGAHACVRTNAGDLHCWGGNAEGQSGSTAVFPGPADRSDATVAVAGAQHTCFVSATGTFCFGDGQGYGASTNATAADPHQLTSLVVGQLDAEGNATCAQAGAGIVCEGGLAAPDISPSDPAHLSVGVLGFACRVEQAMPNVAECWGVSNSVGQLGDPMERNEATLTLCGNVASLDSGRAHTCAVAGADVQCWGANESGQAGFFGASIATPRVVVLP